jgi:S1-C subfamily serine protease
MKSRWLPTVGALLVYALPFVRGDTIILKDGTEVDGIILIQSSTKILIKQGAATKMIPLEDVASIAKSPSTPEIESPPSGTSAPASRANSERHDPLLDSTVMVSATLSEPDFTKPWTKSPPREEHGSGAVIAGNRILTSAHLVNYASDIEVRGASGSKIVAQIVALDTTLDLAVLKLSDDNFFANHPPVEFMPSVPNSGETVSVYGLSENYNSINQLSPSMAALNFEYYTSNYLQLMIRLNTRLDPWMSGGPAASAAGSVFGITCSRQDEGQIFSFVIPSEVILRFLDEVKTGVRKRKSMLYDQTQPFENPALRAFLGAGPGEHGMVVTSIQSKQEVNTFRDWDIITGVSGEEVDDQGMVHFGLTHRVNFAYEYQRLGGIRETLTFVKRGRVALQIFFTPEIDRALLIPDLKGDLPAYFILGPMVFSTATIQMFSQLAKTAQMISYLGIRGSPLLKRREEKPAFPGEQLVFVPSPFFPHPLARGYTEPTFSVVKAVNEIPIKNLGHLVTVMRDSREDFVTIEFAEKFSEILVFPRTEMIAATEGILSDNNVRSQGSPDTMAIWNAK